MSEGIILTGIPVPASLDDPDAGLFRAIAEIGTAVCRHDAGHDHFDHTAQEILPSWQDQTDATRLGFAALRGGEIVGVVTISLSHEKAADEVEFDLMTRPDRWGEGIEEALLGAVETQARARGRSIIQTWTLHSAEGREGQRRYPSSGWGAIPAGDRQTRFMQTNGFELEQVERNSVYDLRAPADLVIARLREAEIAAGPDYRLVTWSGPTPPAHKDTFAYALSRMSTDVPVSGLTWTEEIWDAARVERRDARLAAAGLTTSVAAIVHEPSRAIVAFNELTINADHTSTSHQWGTLVLAEHRGHRLGTIVKCVNILAWRDLMPSSPRISTFNAEENRPMLDINEAIGFVPVSYSGAWKKVIAGSADSSDSTGS